MRPIRLADAAGPLRRAVMYDSWGDREGARRAYRECLERPTLPITERARAEARLRQLGR